MPHLLSCIPTSDRVINFRVCDNHLASVPGTEKWVNNASPKLEESKSSLQQTYTYTQCFPEAKGCVVSQGKGS